MTKIKNTIAGLAFMVGCSILVTGCERNEEMEGNHNGPIRITVNAANATKAVAITTSSLEAAGGFVLDVIADDTWTKVDGDGNPVGTEHAAGAYITSSGAANVLYSSTSHSYTPGSDVRPGTDATEGWYIYDTGYEVYNWINGIKLRFWARYPQDSEIDGGTNEGDLDVTVPGVGGSTESFTYDLPAAAPGSDATNQKDILFAYNERVKQKEDDSDDIDLTFNHALSEIRFCVSPDDETYDLNLHIKSIKIKNVPDGGSCVFDGAGTIDDGDMFTWTPSSSLENYSQAYNASFFIKPSSGWSEASYVNSSHETKHLYVCDNAFMMIPHTTGSTTTLEVTFWDTEYSTDVVREVNIGGDVWKPGHYYTYKINAVKVGRSISHSVYLIDWKDLTTIHDII